MESQENRTLKIQNLYVEFKTKGGIISAVEGVSLEVKRGKITALVGESGSGKSVTSLAVMNLLPPNAKMRSGEIFLGETNVQKLTSKERQELNGTVMGMIFQDPSTSLDPLYTVGNQMIEGIMQHQRIGKKEAYDRAVSCLKAVNLQDSELLMRKYPFELSGGMCQRVMIAITMGLKPSFLIADEPTTALDVTVQQQILTEIYRMSREEEMGVLFITHDLGVVAEIADDVCIMQDGKVVENAEVNTIFENPPHAYTKKLLNSIL